MARKKTAKPAKSAVLKPIAAGSPVYQLKVSLKDAKPPIWRRLQVQDGSLADLHEIIQVAMGWKNYHLYSFEVGDEAYSDPENLGDLDMGDATESFLSDIVPMGKKSFRFSYTYDFGDDWRHEILVEKILPAKEGQAYPCCLDGKRACPPEDVGGVWGYGDILDAIGNPQHERREEYLEWLGKFDPEAFDPETVDQAFRARFRSRQPTTRKGSTLAARQAPAEFTVQLASPFLGRWQIVSMSLWDVETIHDEVEAYFQFEPDRRGSFQFGTVQGLMDYRVVDRGGALVAEFSWEGGDEDQPATGRGWALLDGDEIRGVVFIHLGEESDFLAKRMSG